MGAPPQLNPVLELDGTGAVLYRYVYATMGHSPDYVVNGAGATYRVVRDQLGSPLLIVNITNPSDVLLDARYSAFGTRTATTVAASAPTLGYAGGIYDEDTGLVRFGARDYDALVGRWTSKDPILWDGGQGNLYVYVGNEPINRFDPQGLWDVFGFYALEGGGGTGFIHGGGEYIYIAGYNSESSGYTAEIGAGGFRIGSDTQYVAYHLGLEGSTHGLEGIHLFDFGLFSRGPVGLGFGVYVTDEDHGLYVFGSGGLLGKHGSAGVGWSTKGWWDALRDWLGLDEERTCP